MRIVNMMIIIIFVMRIMVLWQLTFDNDCNDFPLLWEGPLPLQLESGDHAKNYPVHWVIITNGDSPSSPSSSSLHHHHHHHHHHQHHHHHHISNTHLCWLLGKDISAISSWRTGRCRCCRSHRAGQHHHDDHEDDYHGDHDDQYDDTGCCFYTGPPLKRSNYKKLI